MFSIVTHTFVHSVLCSRHAQSQKQNIKKRLMGGVLGNISLISSLKVA